MTIHAWSLIFLAFICIASGQEQCLQNYADVERALLDDPDNSYQIARAFFRPRSEGETLCVTAYYYLGLNSTEEPNRSDCPNVILGRNQELSGCSKWKWCVNTFYMDLNITQLQVFSFFVIYEKTAEIELRIPPFCVSNETMYEYLLRATNSLKLYAEGEGSLDEGRPFLGFAARFNAPNELEPLIKDVNQHSLDVLFDASELFNSEFNEVDAIFLLISLLALPTFAAPLSGILFVDLQKKAHNKIKDDKADLFPFILGFVTTCICGNIIMLFFQMAGFNKDDPWYYVIPYSWLWTLIVIQFMTSLLLTYKFKSTNSKLKQKRRHFWHPFFWLQSFALWVVFATVLMLSWHAVFIMLGFILNPFRAVVLTLVYTIGTICAVMFFSVIFSFCRLMYQCLKVKKCHVYFAVVYLLLMIAVLIFIISYISFMFRINVGGESMTGAYSLTEWINHLLPLIFLLTLTWFLKKLLKLPNKFNKTDEDKKDDVRSLQFDEKLYSNKVEKLDTII